MASVTCLFAAQLTLKSDEKCDFHSHPCTEIVVYRGCSGVLTIGKEPHPYQDGDISIYQPHLQHSDHCRKAGVQMILGVTGCGAETLAPGVWHANSNVLTAADHFLRELHSDDRFHQSTLDVLAGWLVLKIHRQLATHHEAESKIQSEARVEAAKAILDARYNEPLTLRAVARELYIHPDYLRQLFREEVGEAPLHYLLRRRIESARELLHLTDAPIKEIATRVGIPNPYYFSRIFRQWVGRSPSDYRADRRAHPLRTNQ